MLRKAKEALPCTAAAAEGKHPTHGELSPGVLRLWVSVCVFRQSLEILACKEG